MKTWGYFALAAVLFAGVGVFTLRTDSIEWWTVVTATVMFVAAATFASRGVVEYRNADKQP